LTAFKKAEFITLTEDIEYCKEIWLLKGVDRMYGEIITIGNELVSGKTLDLNSWYAAGRLTAAGLRVNRIKSVGDDYKMVSEALKETLKESRFAIITGGLGSTEDDMTCEIVANSLNRPLCINEQMFKKIKSLVEERGNKLTPSIEKMAWMPEGSTVLSPDGAACGFSLKQDKVYLYFLPGVHEQMRYLMDSVVLPDILRNFKSLPYVEQRILKLYGITEPEISEVFKGLKGKTGDVVFGFYPHFPENHITLSLQDKDKAKVVRELDRIENDIRKFLGAYIFASGNKNIEDTVGAMLKERAITIAVAESCTGGLIGNRLTNLPGSSYYFAGGVIVYSNQSKIEFLQVREDTINKYGAVSDETVREMAEGVRRNFKTDMGLAVTGIAGPDGGTKEKPVGTVHIGLASDRNVLSNKYRFWGNREQIKINTSMMALDWIRRRLNGDTFLPGI